MNKVLYFLGRSSLGTLRIVSSILHAVFRDKKALVVRCVRDVHRTSDKGMHIPLRKVVVSGGIFTSFPGPAVFETTITDSTGLKSYPVFCDIPECSDEEGMFSFVQPITIPYEQTLIKDAQVAMIVLPAIRGPRKGHRRFKVTVSLRSKLGHFVTKVSTTFGHKQKDRGYIDIKEKTEAVENEIAALALAVSASDGLVVESEERVIRNFFTERFQWLDESDKKKRQKRVDEALQETLRLFHEEGFYPSLLITQICDYLSGIGDTVNLQEAYELCVKIVAADEKYHPREMEALKIIETRLGLPEEYTRETQDRHLTGLEVAQGMEKNLIDMPIGLSVDDQKRFLRKEYKKWNARVTSSDPEIRDEAERRVKIITAMRNELDNE